MSIVNPVAAVTATATAPVSAAVTAKPLAWWAGWAGFVFGAAGAAILAVNLPWSGWGWLAFLASNVAWITHAALCGPRSLLLQQLVFIGTTIVGIARWLT